MVTGTTSKAFAFTHNLHSQQKPLMKNREFPLWVTVTISKQFAFIRKSEDSDGWDITPPLHLVYHVA
jgi:hypothetical protein